MTKFYRSRKDQKIAGVCGGLGEIYNVDANLVRVLLVFLALVTYVAPLVVAYLVAWMILPEGPDEAPD